MCQLVSAIIFLSPFCTAHSRRFWSTLSSVALISFSRDAVLLRYLVVSYKMQLGAYNLDTIYDLLNLRAINQNI